MVAFPNNFIQIQSMIQYQKKLKSEKARAENIKRNILKYSGVQNSINNIKAIKNKRNNDLNLSKPNFRAAQRAGSKKLVLKIIIFYI